jgi:trimeric autotransporter adhesin
MKRRTLALRLSLIAVACSFPVVTMAQQTAAVGASTLAISSTTAVPKVVNYSGTLTDMNSAAITGTVGVTFYLYKDSEGGAPLWMETQNVNAGKTGHYTVTLGSTTSAGLPQDVFASGEARWLGVQVQGQAEQARVLLVAVPYALKSRDAETLGGLPASAFLLAAPAGGVASAPNSVSAVTASVPPPPGTITGTGTAGFLPDFTGTTTLGNSALFQQGASPNARIGINTSTPAATLDVKGAATVRGVLALPPTAPATAAAGTNSQAMNLIASAFNSTTSTATNEVFAWRAEPSANDTPAPRGNLSLLFGQGATPPAETGLRISNKGVVTFAAGQTFPGTGSGTVSSVGSGFGLTGGPITSTGALAIDTSVVPRLAASNSFSGNQSVTGNISASGSITGGSIVGNGAGLSGVNAATLGGFTAGAFAFVGGSNTFSGAQVINNTLSVASGETFGSTIQFTDNGAGSTLQTPLMINAADCCTFGDRMIWAHSPGFLQWGIYYDDDQDVMHWQQEIGSDLMTLDFFTGDLNVTGTITGASKDFKIDHPLDPTNKYLYHGSVESSEMMNIYSGNAVLDSDGKGVVSLPEWFEAVNEDFRYQLTAVGAAAPNLHVASEVANHQFSIEGGVAGMKVSWQVTAVRHDAYAKVHPLVVEVKKSAKDRGHYLHPEAYGAPRLTQEEMFRQRKLSAPSKSQATLPKLQAAN